MIFNLLDFENIDFKGLSEQQLKDLFNKLKSYIDEGNDDLKNTLLNLLHQIDGSGSGIDADLLDGHDSSYFLPKTGKAADSDKLDGLHASSFLRRDTSSSPTQNNTFNLGSPTEKWKNIYATTFNGTAVQAEYADLAEKYYSKDELEIGDVVCISSDKQYEIEKCNEIGSYKVIGVFSFNPAFKMNSEGKGDYIALKGRVPVKIIGPVNKGDPLITYKDGYAISIFNKNLIGNVKIESYAIFGKALENVKNGIKSLIKAVIL